MKKVSDELHNAAQEIIREGLRYMNKQQLKEMCRSQMLHVSGNKDKLVSNLMAYYNTCKIDVSMRPTTASTEVTVEASHTVPKDDSPINWPV